jgi:hypothetical protein
MEPSTLDGDLEIEPVLFRQTLEGKKDFAATDSK